MIQQVDILTDVANEGIIGMTDYIMPIVSILSIMAIFGFRIVLFSGAPKNKRYIFQSISITIIMISSGIILTLIDEKIAEPIISAITTIIFVLFAIQIIIQLKLKRNK